MTMREWRRARGITQKQLAETCGVHPNTIRGWEEHPERVSIADGKTIAKALNVTLDDISFASSATKCS